MKKNDFPHEVWGVKRSGKMRGRRNRAESRLFTTS